MKFNLTGEFNRRIECEIASRLYPDSSDYWDRNLLLAKVSAYIDGFTALFSCNLRADEIKIWVDTLESFLQKNINHIELKTMEEGLYFKANMDLLENIEWECVLKSADDSKAILSFTLSSWLSVGQQLSIELKKILNKYPIMGNPT